MSLMPADTGTLEGSHVEFSQPLDRADEDSAAFIPGEEWASSLLLGITPNYTYNPDMCHMFGGPSPSN